MRVEGMQLRMNPSLMEIEKKLEKNVLKLRENKTRWELMMRSVES